MATNKGDHKGELRSSRMTLKHSNHDEDVLHNDFLRECRKKCDKEIKDFVQCSKEQGLMVIFRCRQHSRIMNECLKPLSTDEKFRQYKLERGFDAKPSK